MLNSGVPDPVEITQISTAGRHWRTETLLEPSEAVVLDPQQVGVVALKASPIVDDGSDDAGFIVPQLELLLRGGQDIKGRTPPLTNLTLSSSALVRSLHSLHFGALTLDTGYTCALGLRGSFRPLALHVATSRATRAARARLSLH